MKRCKTILVCGSSIDGKISVGRNISSKEFGQYLPKNLDFELHKIRSVVDGILVSINTIITDNPSLTARKLPSSKNPVRILLDRQGRVPEESKILNEKAKTINTNPILATAIFNYKNENNDQNLKNEFYLFLKQSVSNFVNFGKNNNRK